MYSEILKLKRCYMLFSIIACGVFMPTLNFIHYLTFPQKVSLEAYVILDEWGSFVLMMIIITTLLSSYIFLREYADNAIRVLYSYPISKISILISKVIIIYGVLAIVYVLHGITLFGGGLILDRGGFLLKSVTIDATFFFIHLKMQLFSLLLLFSLVPFLVFITNLFKNLIVTVILGVLGAVTNLLTVESEWCVYSPLMLPAMPFTGFSDPVDPMVIFYLSLGSFIVGAVLCIYQFSKLEEL